MTDVHWLFQSSPGDIAHVSVAADTLIAAPPSAMCVVTSGGHVHMRRRTVDEWRWEQLGTPPGNTAVVGAACLTVDAAGAVAPVVIGGTDGHVWLTRPGPPSTGWVDLGAPASDSRAIAAGTVRAGGGLRHLLVLASDSGRLWVREGLDAGGTWLNISPGANWEVTELALALGTLGAGQEPVQHIFAVTHDFTTHEAALRVAAREGDGWTWIDPGPRPGPDPPSGLSATCFRDAGGALRACAMIGDRRGEPVGAASVDMLVGAGLTWRWESLGRPPGNSLPRSAVVAGMGSPPVGGAPLAVARVDHHIWKRPLGGEWEDLGTAPGDTRVVDPVTAVTMDSPATGRTLWSAGASWDGHLWTLLHEGDEVRWTGHGPASSVSSVLGMSHTVSDIPSTLGARLHVHLLDEHGRLWRSASDLSRARSWEDLGRPGATVAAKSPVGVVTTGDQRALRTWAFVLGSDGRLWARAPADDATSWIDHSVPPGRRIRACLAPTNTGPGADEACVPVLADDGHLWLRTVAGPEARWNDRGNPPGGRIFAVVGAGPLSGSSSGLPFVAVAADDGHLWLNKPEAASAWIDLGAPATGEQVVAGIGALDVTLTGGAVAVEVVVVGSPSGHVWTRGWSPESTAGRWADLGNPTDRRIQAAIGLVPNVPASGRSTFIVAGDMQLWVRRKAGPDEQWTRWGRPHTSPGFGSGCGAVWPLAHRFATAALIATDRRVWIPLPPELNRELFGVLAWAEEP